MPAHPLWSLVAPLLAPMPLIWASQNGNRPGKPYGTLNITSAAEAPFIVESEPDEDGIVTISELRLIRAEVNIFGPGAFDAAQRLGLSIRKPTTTYRAEALGLGMSRVVQVLDATALLNDIQYEERAILEFQIYAAGSITDDIGLIEHVVLEPGTPGPLLDFTGCTEVISSPTAATPPPEPGA